MENENKQCDGCKYFNGYYTKGIKQFHKTKLGLCLKRVTTVGVCDCCDKFKPKPAEQRNEKLTRLVLSEMLTELSHIRQVIEENHREKM